MAGCERLRPESACFSPIGRAYNPTCKGRRPLVPQLAERLGQAVACLATGAVLGDNPCQPGAGFTDFVGVDLDLKPGRGRAHSGQPTNAAGKGNSGAITVVPFG